MLPFQHHSKHKFDNKRLYLVGIPSVQYE